MPPELKKNQDFLIIFFLLWIGLTLWVLRYYPLIKDFNFSKLSPSQVNIIFLISLASIFSLIMSGVYLYRVSQWLNLSNFYRIIITFVFIVVCLVSVFISAIIVILVLYGVKKKYNKRGE